MAARNPETQVAAPTAAPVEINEFENLLNKQFKPKTDTAKEAVQAAVKTLAEQALASTQLITKDAVASIEALVADLHALTSPLHCHRRADFDEHRYLAGVDGSS